MLRQSARALFLTVSFTAILAAQSEHRVVRIDSPESAFANPELDVIQRRFLDA